MSTHPYSVLVVDDSALMRNLVGRIFEHDPQTMLAGKAMNGKFALQKLESLQPEVIILDLEMPEMNGIEFLSERKKRGIDIPVVVLSSVAHSGAKITMEALALGAAAFVLKPSGSVSPDIAVVADELLQLVKSLGAAHRDKYGEPDRPVLAKAPPPKPVQKRVQPAPVQRPSISAGPIDVVAIGISTGGPNALRKVFAQLPGDLPAAVLIVQHMPPGFTAEFAKSLDRVSQFSVKEAEEGDEILPGHALVAPGNFHLSVVKRGAKIVAHVSQEPARNGHRPSADVLFESVAKHYGNRGLGVIMTGMGKDGAQELGSILKAGGLTLGQNEESSVVYGMPRVAFELGHVETQVSLPETADAITRLVHEHR
jgi:two-component system chemotaxis response regulator CheB